MTVSAHEPENGNTAAVKLLFSPTKFNEGGGLLYKLYQWASIHAELKSNTPNKRRSLCTLWSVRTLSIMTGGSWRAHMDCSVWSHRIVGWNLFAQRISFSSLFTNLYPSFLLQFDWYEKGLFSKCWLLCWLYSARLTWIVLVIHDPYSRRLFFLMLMAFKIAWVYSEEIFNLFQE